MRALWTGYVQFGMVVVPVRMYSASKPNDVAFKTLERATEQPIKQKRFSSVAEDKEVDDFVKGYPLGGDKYVVIEDCDIQRMQHDKDKSLNIEGFVDVKEIDPIWYNKSYYLGPGEAGDKAYKLLFQAMHNTGKAGIGKFVMRNKQQVAIVRPFHGVLVASTLTWHEEMYPPQLVPIGPLSDVDKSEVELGEKLVQHMSIAFDPQKYVNEYRQRVLDMIEAKSQGVEVAMRENPSASIISDLRAALEGSIG